MTTYQPLSESPRRSGSPISLRELEVAESFPEEVLDRPGLTRQHRSSTFTSVGGFDFASNLLPLTPSGQVDDHRDASHKGEDKHVSMLHGMGLIIGTQVGSGIFSSPGVVVAEVGSVGASLIVWVLSALLAWTGASSFTELGCAIPISGGAQAYLAYAYGPMLSYLYTWTAVSVIKPGSAAIISLIFGEYINRMIYHAMTGDEESAVPEWTFKLTATVAVFLVAALNLASQSAGTKSSVIITSVKMCSLVFVGVLGLVHLARNGPGPALTTDIFQGTSTSPGNYAIALYSGLWAFDGWDACSFIAGEMKDTHRDLPRALHSSMSIVLVLFLGANVAYFEVLSPSVVASTNTVALDFGRVTIGKLGAVVFSTLVAISCFGALNASFYTSAKLIYASAKEKFLPDIFARIHHRRRTPDHAMALQASLTIFYILFGGGFRSLLNFFSVTSWTFYLLTVLGLLVLRVQEPHLERPYRAWIITPIIFCGVAMFLLLMPIFAAPLEALAAVVFMATGVPMYYMTMRSRSVSHLAESSFRAKVSSAWQAFIEDVQTLRSRKTARTRTVGRDMTSAEERQGMLRGQTVEMSERS